MWKKRADAVPAPRNPRPAGNGDPDSVRPSVALSEPTAAQIEEIGARVAQQSRSFQRLREEVGRVVVGQERLIRGMLTGLLSGGHVLIEGVPGIAKTTAVTSLAHAVELSFQRLQFTPDLLPGDVVGTQIYRPQDGNLEVQTGPIFANLVLVDEVNRAPAKVQSALLEAMQERQVTIAGETFVLPDPFLVIATQNPIEQEGTYRLPEAQTDRFLLKVLVGYPNRDEELQILDRMGRTGQTATTDPVLSPETIVDSRALIDDIYMDQRVRDYIVDLVMATRDPYRFGAEVGDLVQFGVSPRGTLALSLAARVHAFLDGRGFVTPDDVKDMAYEVLRHRIILSYEAEAEERTPDDVLQVIMSAVPVP